MVEVEIRKAETGNEEATGVKLDLNEIISKVRDFVNGIMEVSMGGKPMAVGVEGFNFSVGKADGEYELSLNLTLTFKSKEPKSTEYEPF